MMRFLPVRSGTTWGVGHLSCRTTLAAKDGTAGGQGVKTSIGPSRVDYARYRAFPESPAALSVAASRSSLDGCSLSSLTPRGSTTTAQRAWPVR